MSVLKPLLGLIAALDRTCKGKFSFPIMILQADGDPAPEGGGGDLHFPEGIEKRLHLHLGIDAVSCIVA